jgi:glutathione peroxidase
MQGGSPPPDANDVAVPPAPRLDSGKPPGDSGDGGFVCDPPAAPGSFYALSARNLANTRDVSMCEFRGKVILVVNTASYCGYTPQYKGLEDDYEKYQAQGFVILGFPCNQFGMQEPGDASDISNFCTSMYGVTFPMFQKIDVNGPNAHPIYVWLKAQPGGAGDITWNFNKFLLGRDGKLIKRYDSAVDPANPTLIADIEAALAK